jgi:transcriptional regulator with XRE-family HTH domain
MFMPEILRLTPKELKRLRAKKMSQAKLAKLIGLNSKAQISRMETGERPISLAEEHMIRCILGGEDYCKLWRECQGIY